VKCGAEPNVGPPGAVSPIGETIYGIEISLLATPHGDCNRINLRFMHSVHFWVGKH